MGTDLREDRAVRTTGGTVTMPSGRRGRGWQYVLAAIIAVVALVAAAALLMPREEPVSISTERLVGAGVLSTEAVEMSSAWIRERGPYATGGTFEFPGPPTSLREGGPYRGVETVSRADRNENSAAAIREQG
ncbi:MAG: hypothetical protein ACRDHI_09725 [Actinomycetota bacterium]